MRDEPNRVDKHIWPYEGSLGGQVKGCMADWMSRAPIIGPRKIEFEDRKCEKQNRIPFFRMQVVDVFDLRKTSAPVSNLYKPVLSCT